MIAVPRSVISIQSPWRQMPGIHLEVGGAVALAVRVGPKEDGHRGHRLGDDELAHLADERRCRLRPTPRRRSRGRGPGARRDRRGGAGRRRRTRCTRRCRPTWRRARCRGRRARRPTRSPRAPAANRSSRRRRAREVATLRGLDSRLHAGGEEARRGAEGGDLGLRREVPEGVERRGGRGCRRRGRSTRR